MKPFLILGLAAVLAVAACGRREEQAQVPDAPAAPVPAGPLTYEKKTAAAEVSLSLPERVAQLPALYAKLYSEGRNNLDAFAEAVVEDAETARAAGFPAEFAKEVDYTLAAETPRLVSLGVSTYENTGGAHPNGSIAGLLWDKQTGRTVTTAELFAPGANMAAADKALCDALKAAKRERTGSDAFDTMFAACPKVVATQVTLLPSTAPNKAAGLTVLFSPYEVGPYAEGTYEIDLALPAIQGVLAPAYAAEFGGTPAPQPAAQAAAPATE